MALYLKRLQMVVAVFALTIITHSYFGTRKPLPTSSVYVCKGIPAKNTITPLKGTQTFIIAAYFDNRRNYRNATRLLGIAHHSDIPKLFCWFCCTSNSEIQITRAKIKVHSDWFGFPYGATDLYCWEPKNCHPRFVLIHKSKTDMSAEQPLFEIKNREATVRRVQFTLCVSPMYGEYNNILQFVQSMEMYKILGVDKVVIYKISCSQLMEKVLDFYVREGTLEIISWPIESYLRASSFWHYSMDAKDIGYYGQIAAMNDCVYRYMHKSRYILINDVDEIILPVKHWNWKIMMQELQKRYPTSGVFLFENHIFPKTVFTPINLVNISSWRTVPGINILEHVLREPDRKHISNPYKMIVVPRSVGQTSIHTVLKQYGWLRIYVRKEVALIYHCRIPLQPSLPRESLIEDTTLWRYNMSLIRNVNHVLQQTVLLPKE